MSLACGITGGCTPSVLTGSYEILDAGKGPEWLTQVKGDDSYIRIWAETIADPIPGQPAIDLCSSNALAQWWSRDRKSSITHQSVF